MGVLSFYYKLEWAWILYFFISNRLNDHCQDFNLRQSAQYQKTLYVHQSDMSYVVSNV